MSNGSGASERSGRRRPLPHAGKNEREGVPPPASGPKRVPGKPGHPFDPSTGAGRTGSDQTSPTPAQPGPNADPATEARPPSSFAIGFIGAGNVGRSLAMALSSRGYRVTAVASRSYESATALAALVPGCTPRSSLNEVAAVCDLIFVTTPDDAIRSVSAEVPWRQGQGAVHCSGADTLEVLSQASLRGAVVGSFHPLQTFAGDRLATPDDVLLLLRGVTFAVDGEGWVRATLERMAADLGGSVVHIPPDLRAIYHASAVLSCGYLAGLLHAARDLWQSAGFDGPDPLQALMPLARGTIDSLDRIGFPRGVTGPVVRGDRGTLRRHLDALGQHTPHLLPAYCFLGLESLSIARERGVNETVVREMEGVIYEHLGRYTAAAARAQAAPVARPRPS